MKSIAFTQFFVIRINSHNKQNGSLLFYCIEILDTFDFGNLKPVIHSFTVLIIVRGNKLWYKDTWIIKLKYFLIIGYTNNDMVYRITSNGELRIIYLKITLYQINKFDKECKDSFSSLSSEFPHLGSFKVTERVSIFSTIHSTLSSFVVRRIAQV